MGGRKPRGLSLATHAIAILEHMAHSRTLPWFQVQRARAVLAIADGERVQTVAFQMQCDPSTVWCLCRRYEQAGLKGLLAEAPRPGHPAEISPLQRAQIVQLACSVRARCAAFCTKWICSRIVPAIGKQRDRGVRPCNNTPRIGVSYSGCLTARLTVL